MKVIIAHTAYELSELTKGYRVINVVFNDFRYEAFVEEEALVEEEESLIDVAHRYDALADKLVDEMTGDIELQQPLPRGWSKSMSPDTSPNFCRDRADYLISIELLEREIIYRRNYASNTNVERS
jgi:hypothetical protein